MSPSSLTQPPDSLLPALSTPLTAPQTVRHPPPNPLPVAHNSSGVAFGKRHNGYQTLESVVLVLPSGTVLDTGALDADECLRVQEPELHEGLVRLRDRVRSNPASVRIIERQFAMKNTMGYGLNSFLDHNRPVDVLPHRGVDSQGTPASRA